MGKTDLFKSMMSIFLAGAMAFTNVAPAMAESATEASWEDSAGGYSEDEIEWDEASGDASVTLPSSGTAQAKQTQGDVQQLVATEAGKAGVETLTATGEGVSIRLSKKDGSEMPAGSAAAALSKANLNESVEASYRLAIVRDLTDGYAEAFGGLEENDASALERAVDAAVGGMTFAGYAAVDENGAALGGLTATYVVADKGIAKAVKDGKAVKIYGFAENGSVNDVTEKAKAKEVDGKAEFTIDDDSVMYAFFTMGTVDFDLDSLEAADDADREEAEAETEEAKPETQDEAEPETALETETETDVVLETETATEAKAETEAATEAKSESVAETETTAETELATETETDAATEASMETETVTETERSTEAVTEAETETEAMEKAEVEADLQVDGSIVLDESTSSPEGEVSIIIGTDAERGEEAVVRGTVVLPEGISVPDGLNVNEGTIETIDGKRFLSSWDDGAVEFLSVDATDASISFEASAVIGESGSVPEIVMDASKLIAERKTDGYVYYPVDDENEEERETEADDDTIDFDGVTLYKVYSSGDSDGNRVAETELDDETEAEVKGPENGIYYTEEEYEEISGKVSLEKALAPFVANAGDEIDVSVMAESKSVTYSAAETLAIEETGYRARQLMTANGTKIITTQRPAQYSGYFLSYNQGARVTSMTGFSPYYHDGAQFYVTGATSPGDAKMSISHAFLYNSQYYDIVVSVYSLKKNVPIRVSKPRNNYLFEVAGPDGPMRTGSSLKTDDGKTYSNTGADGTNLIKIGVDITFYLNGNVADVSGSYYSLDIDKNEGWWSNSFKDLYTTADSSLKVSTVSGKTGLEGTATNEDVTDGKVSQDSKIGMMTFSTSGGVLSMIYQAGTGGLQSRVGGDGVTMTYHADGDVPPNWSATTANPTPITTYGTLGMPSYNTYSGYVVTNAWRVQEEGKTYGPGSTIYMNGNKNAYVTYERLGSITVHKAVNKNGTEHPGTLLGYTFRLSGPTAKADIKTDANGNATWTDLKRGTYTITEVGTSGTSAAWNVAASQTVNLSPSGEWPSTTKTFTNTVKAKNVTVHKTVTDPSYNGYYGTSAQGYSFTISGSTTLGFAFTAKSGTTDANGNVTFANVPYGTYTITENNLPSWVKTVTSNPTQNVVVNDAFGGTVNWTNTKKVGSLTVTKSVVNSSNLRSHDAKAGFKFKISGTPTSNQGTFTETVTTDTNGKATFVNVPLGDNYTITEVGTSDSAGSVPEWWEVRQNNVSGTTASTGVKIAEGDNTSANGTKVNFTNEYKTGSVKLTTIDSKVVDKSGWWKLAKASNWLAGFRFKIRTKSGKTTKSGDAYESAELLTDTNGEITFENVPIADAGVYETVMTGVPSATGTQTIGSQGNIPSYWNDANAQGKTTTAVSYKGPGTVSIQNEFKAGRITVKKIVEDPSHTTEELDGFVFRLTGSTDSGLAYDSNRLPGSAATSTDADGTFSVWVPVSTNASDAIKVQEVGVTDDQARIAPWWKVMNEIQKNVTVTWNGNNDATKNSNAAQKPDSDNAIRPVTNLFKTGYASVRKKVNDPSGQVPQDDLSGYRFKITGHAMNGRYYEEYATTGKDGVATFKTVPVTRAKKDGATGDGTMETGSYKYTITEVSTYDDQLVDDDTIRTWWDWDMNGAHAKTENVAVDFGEETSSTGTATSWTNTFKTGSIDLTKIIDGIDGYALNQNTRSNFFFRLYTPTASDLNRLGLNDESLWPADELGNAHSRPDGPDAAEGTGSIVVDMRGMTNADGKIVDLSLPPTGGQSDSRIEKTGFNNIPVGTYVLEEYQTPESASNEMPEYWDPWMKIGTGEKIRSKGTVVRISYENGKAKVTPVEITNELEKGKLIVKKEVTDDSGLFAAFQEKNGRGLNEGFKFELVGESDARLILSEDQEATDKNGYATFTDVPVGTYHLREVGTPDDENGKSVANWWDAQDDVVVEVKYYRDVESDDEITYVVKNTYETGTVKVHKKIDDDTNTKTDLSGFTFTLTGTSDSGEKVDMEATTGEDGVATFENVPVKTNGEYALTETKADGKTSVPEWWVPGEEQGVNVNYGRTTEKTFINRYISGDVLVKKTVVDPSGEYSKAVKGNDLAGFKFKLSGKLKDGTSYEKTVETNSKGEATFKDVPAGSYKVEEVGTPAGDDDNLKDGKVPDWWTVDVTYSDEEITVGEDKSVGFYSVTNTYQTGSVQVQKKITDESGRYKYEESLKGFTFRLSGTSASGVNYSKDATTNKDGIAIWNDVPVGTEYTVEEIATPDGAGSVSPAWGTPTVSVGEGELVVAAGKTKNVTVTNELKTGDLVVAKKLIDKSHDYKTAGGFKFHLYGASKAGMKVDMYATTDSSGATNDTADEHTGKAYFNNVPDGEYTIEEVSGPRSDVVAGAGWKTEVNNVETTSVKVTVAAGKEAGVTFTNTYKTGRVVLTKEVIDESNEGIATRHDAKDGFVFTLKGTPDSGDAEIAITATTDASGVATFDNVPFGTYAIEETKTRGDNGVGTWWKTEKPKQVTVNSETKDVEIAFRNVYRVGSVVITKKVEGKLPESLKGSLAGFGFRLRGTADNGDKVDLKGVTEADGTLRFDGVPVNEKGYTLEEISTPDDKIDDGTIPTWWTATERSQKVTVGEGEPTRVTVTNRYHYGKVTVRKQIENKSKVDVSLKGFEFVLTGTANDGRDVEMKATTNSDGVATFENVPEGDSYSVRETSTPDDDLADDEIPTWWKTKFTDGTEGRFELADNGDVELAVTNEYRTGAIKVHKTVVDPSGKHADASGFEFELTGTSDSGISYEGDAKLTAVTGSDGYATFENLPIGAHYVIRETGAPKDGSMERPVDAKVWKTVPENGVVDGAEATDATKDGKTYDFTNRYMTGSFTVAKAVDDPSGLFAKFQNENGRALNEGFVFRIKGVTEDGGEYDEIKKTDANGRIAIENVPVGTYEITEIGTPESPEKISEHWEVRKANNVLVLKDGANDTVEVENVFKTGGVQVLKSVVDPSGFFRKRFGANWLEGFEFSLSGQSDSTLNVDLKATTNGSGVATFENVPVGTYRLKEIGTPDKTFGKDGADWKTWWDSTLDGVNGLEIEVRVEQGETKAIQVVNVYKSGDVDVIKKVVDPSGEYAKIYGENNYAGFEFTMTGTGQGGERFEGETALVETTDEDGLATFKNVPIGTYVVTETKTPDGNGGVGSWWTVTDISGDVTVEYDPNAKGEDKTPATYTVTNTYKTGDLQVVKKVEDASGHFTRLDGFTFELKGTSESGVAIDRFSEPTDAEGVTWFRNVPVGAYEVNEVLDADGTEMPSWWDVQTQGRTVEIKTVGTDPIEFKNVNKTGELIVEKEAKDASDNALSKAGFTFTLDPATDDGKTAYGADFHAEMTTGTDGIIRFTGVPEGDYWLEEVSTPDSDDEGTTWRNWWDVQNPDDAEDDAPVKRLVHVAYGAKNAETERFLNVLETGSFEFTKIVTDPDGWSAKEQEKAGRALAEGFEFKVYGTEKSGKAYGPKTFKTDADGKFRIETIQVGEYFVEEIGTPDHIGSLERWWDAKENPIAFTVEYGKTTEKSQTNEYETGSVTVTKRVIDQSGKFSENDAENRLKDFTFTLEGYSYSGVKVQLAVKTGKDGVAKFDNVPIGTYTLKEYDTSDSADKELWKKWWSTEFDGVSVTEREVEVTYGNDLPIDVLNVYEQGDVRVEKEVVDESGVHADVFGSDRLKGFTFSLTGTSESGVEYKAGDLTATTDENGVAEFKNVPVGEYQVTEIRTNDGTDDEPVPSWWRVTKVVTDASVDYDADKQTAENEYADKEPTIVKVVNEYLSGGFEITKTVDDPTRHFNSFEGWTFLIKGTSDSGEKIRWTTEPTDGTGKTSTFIKEDGKTKTKALPVGDYVVNEIKALDADGNVVPVDEWWDIHTQNQKVRIDYGEASTVEFTNVYETGSLTVHKTVIDPSGKFDVTGKGFTFRLTGVSESGENVDLTAITDGHGIAKFSHVPIGYEYELTEIGAPDSFEIGKWWDIEYSQKTKILIAYARGGWNEDVYVTNVYETGKVTIAKSVIDPSGTFSDDDASGFTFRLSGYSESKDWIDMLATSEKDGTVTFDHVPVGTEYKIEEIATPEHPDGVPEWWDAKNRVFENVEVKYDDETHSIEDDKMGELASKGRDERPQETKLEALNVYKTGNLTVTKEVEDPSGMYLRGLDHPAQGFTFKLEGNEERLEGKVYEGTTDEDGRFTFDNIPVGEYLLTETGSPDGPEGYEGKQWSEWWSTEKRSRKVTVGYDNDPAPADGAETKVTEDQTFVNVYKTGDVKAVKKVVDPSGNVTSAAGFKFDLRGWTDSGLYYWQEGVTGEDGTLTFENVPVGTYNLNEIGTPDFEGDSVPDWWMVEDKTTVVESAFGETKEYVVTNTYKTGDVKVYKTVEIVEAPAVKEERYSLEGFAFKLWGTSDSGVAVEKYAVTDAYGLAKFEDVPIGTYHAIEITAEELFEAAKINESAAAATPKAKQELDEYVSPVRFDVEVKFGKDAPDVTEVDQYNELTKTRINLMDYDTEEELNGAIVSVVDPDGKTVARFTTDHEANATIAGLKKGVTYTFVVETPRKGYYDDVFAKDGYVSKYDETGYVIGGKTFESTELPIETTGGNSGTFTVQDVGGIQTVSAFLKPVKGELDATKLGETPVATVEDGKLSKISWTLNGLPGAEYEVTAADDVKHPDGWSGNVLNKGDVVATLVTDENGQASIADLWLGKYEIRETKAPAGYVLEESKATKTVDLKALYEENVYGLKKWSERTYAAEIEFVNDRQKVDVGTDEDPQPGPNPGRNTEEDPEGELYGKSGVYKLDAETGKPVAGAAFTLYAKDDVVDANGNVAIPAGTEIETAKTGKDGRARFLTDLPLGTYEVRETDAPYGYYSTNATVTIDAVKHAGDDAVKVVRAKETISNVVTKTTIFLKDDLTKNELPGATIVVRDPDGNEIARFTTEDTDGKGKVVEGLDPGVEYDVVVEKPRTGYLDDVLDENGNPAGDGNKISVTVPVETVDDPSAAPEGPVVDIYAAFVTGNVRINKEGEVLGEIPVKKGTATVAGRAIETAKATAKYELAAMSGIEFTVFAKEDVEHPDGKTGVLFKAGEVVKQHVRTISDDAVGYTDENGNLAFEQLHLGTYVVKETKTPDGYATNSKETIVTLAYAGPDEPSVEALEGIAKYVNEKQDVTVKVTKTDAETGELLQDAVFGLYNAEAIMSSKGTTLAEAGTLLETARTDADGVAEFSMDLPLGGYVIREIAAPAGYYLSNEEIAVDAKADGSGDATLAFSESFKNDKTKVSIVKVDPEGEAVEGAELELLDRTGKKVTGWTSGKTAATIEGLTAGRTYTLTEVEAPEGYATAEDVRFTVEDAADGVIPDQIVTMVDDPIKVRIDVYGKKDGEKADLLPGVKYHVENALGETVKIDGKDLTFESADELAKAIERIPAGRYSIVVDEVPAGYLIPDPVRMVVADKADLQTFEVIVPMTKVSIQSVDRSTQEPIRSIVDVVDENGNVVYENVELEWVVDKMVPGTYVVKFKEVPDGYVLPGDAKIHVDDKEGEQKFVIPVDYTRVLIRPIDKSTRIPIAEGVYVDVIDKDGNKILENVQIETLQYKLKPGDYVVRTVAVPEGYVIPEDRPITVKAKNVVQGYLIEYDHVKVAIKPVDKTGADVNGVEMKLVDKDGKTVGEWTSMGWKLFEFVKPGTYTIVTTFVPDGYKIPKDKKVEIESIADLQTFEVKLDGSAKAPLVGTPNVPAGGSAGGSGTPQVTLPKTGDDLNVGALAAAIAALVALIAAGYVLTRKKEDEA